MPTPRRRPLIVATLLLAASHGAAFAIVGPSSDAKDLASSVVMVLQRTGPVAGFCSGIVLAPRVVLTAAHCTPPAADLRIHFKAPDGSPVLVPVAAVSRHPGYRADAVQARKRSIDLALIRLPAALPPPFRPARLGALVATRVGAAFDVAGFGVSREGEGTTSGTLRVATLEAGAPLSSVLLWARDPARRGAGACTGDSGGPVLDATSGDVEALTLWSAGDGAHACGALTQALWLAPHRAWMASVLAGWGLDAP